MNLAGQNVVVFDCEIINSPDQLPTRWSDLKALGLSIAGCYDYQTDRLFYFDTPLLPKWWAWVLTRRPLLVTFNGVRFDVPLLKACAPGVDTTSLDSVWHYDLYRAFADAAPDWARVKGMNTLETICEDLQVPGAKSGAGADMPLFWQAGRIAEVVNHCAADVLLTKRLLDHVCTRRGEVVRRGRTLWLPYVTREGGQPVVYRHPGS